jgi:hypothetical protein
MGMPEDVASHLVSTGRITALGTDCFINWMPETPDAVVVLTETGGSAPEYSLGGSQPPVLRSYGLQVRVRGAITGAQAARTLIENIWSDLGLVSSRTINSTVYHVIVPVSSPMYLGRDTNERPEFTANFIAEV